MRADRYDCLNPCHRTRAAGVRRRNRRVPGDQPNQRLDDPVVAVEFGRDPVEQLRVGGQFARRAEVVGGADQARSEHPVPQPVGQDACCERVVAMSDPAAQLEPPALLVGEAGSIIQRDHLQETTWCLAAQVVDVATNVDPGVRDGLFLLDRHVSWLVGSLLLQDFQLLLQSAELLLFALGLLLESNTFQFATWGRLSIVGERRENRAAAARAHPGPR